MQIFINANKRDRYPGKPIMWIDHPHSYTY